MGKMKMLNGRAHFQTNKAQSIPLRTGSRNLDRFFKDIPEIPEKKVDTTENRV